MWGEKREGERERERERERGEKGRQAVSHGNHLRRAAAAAKLTRGGKGERGRARWEDKRRERVCVCAELRLWETRLSERVRERDTHNSEG